MWPIFRPPERSPPQGNARFRPVQTLGRASAFDPLRTFDLPGHKAHMRLLLTMAAPALLGATIACSTPAAITGRCAAASLQQVIENPLRYAGSWYCGEALVARSGRTIRIMRTPDEMASYETVLLATTATSPLLGEIGSRPTRYYIEGRIDPARQCFQAPADNGEHCVPWKRPVSIHLRQATHLR
jgi:hypothetical protein